MTEKEAIELMGAAYTEYAQAYRSDEDENEPLYPRNKYTNVIAYMVSKVWPEYSQLQAENKRLKELLEEAWGPIEELVTQCASDVATACWPVNFGYSEKDVKRINKRIEQVLKGE